MNLTLRTYKVYRQLQGQCQTQGFNLVTPGLQKKSKQLAAQQAACSACAVLAALRRAASLITKCWRALFDQPMTNGSER